MLRLLKAAWEGNPDQRLGQLVANAGRDPRRRPGEDYRDLFEGEDDELWEGLERIAKGDWG
jgi:hypothetical protein